MLAPKRVKFRKMHKTRLKGNSSRGTYVAFGDIGIKALTPGKITAQQIESARIAINRHIKRGGKVWIRIFPHRSFTSKPAEVRMGKGKGAPEGWIAPVAPGRVLYEVKGVDIKTAKEALTRAMHKLPVKCAIVYKDRV